MLFAYRLELAPSSTVILFQLTSAAVVAVILTLTVFAIDTDDSSWPYN